MRLHVAAILSALTLSVLAAGAYGEPGGHSRGGHFGMPGGDFRNPEEMLERMTVYLDLDDTQEQNVRNILDAAKPEIDALRERGEANREAMRTLDANDPNRASTINTIALENGQLATEATLLFDRIHTDVNAVLTDEQRAKLAERRDKMHERWGKRGDKRRWGWRDHHGRDDQSGSSEESS